MKLITKRKIIRQIANEFDSYYKLPDGSFKYNENKKIISEKLHKLNLKTATEEKVTEIIGNSSWTRIICDECNKNVAVAMELGEKPDYESRTAVICLECFYKAYKLINSLMVKNENITCR